MDILVGFYDFANTVLLLFGLIGGSYSMWKLNVKTDISYGIYIYHMTIVNAMLVLGYVKSPLYLLVVVGITVLCSSLSTITIGRYFMNKKQKLALRDN